LEPTSKLRFVERFVPTPADRRFLQKARILQQWWENSAGEGEWRDVMTTPEDAA